MHEDIYTNTSTFKSPAHSKPQFRAPPAMSLILCQKQYAVFLGKRKILKVSNSLGLI